MQRTQLPTLLALFSIFLTIEATRVALWAARTLDDPDDRDGPVLRLLCVRMIGLLCALIPRPVWTLGGWVVWAAGVPVRVLLWVWGVGRGHVEIRKRYPAAVRKWYAQRRVRRAELVRPREKDVYA